MHVRPSLVGVALGLGLSVACASPSSPTTTFPIADGSYSYALSLSPLDTCRPLPLHLNFAGKLTAAGAEWRFAATQLQTGNGFPLPADGIEVAMTVVGRAVTGTIGGGPSLDGEFRVRISRAGLLFNDTTATDLAGEVDAEGIVVATFQGDVKLEGNDTGDQGRCSASVYTATLSPCLMCPM